MNITFSHATADQVAYAFPELNIQIVIKNTKNIGIFYDRKIPTILRLPIPDSHISQQLFLPKRPVMDFSSFLKYFIFLTQIQL